MEFPQVKDDISESGGFQIEVPVPRRKDIVEKCKVVVKADRVICAHKDWIESGQ